MKRPWLSLAAFCVVFSSIIIFCVIFGGFSSLYRAQNRIYAAKKLVTAECQKQLNLLPELIAMAEKTKNFNGIDGIKRNLIQANQTALKTKAILTRINSKNTPLERKTILAFEQSQVQVSREIINLIIELKKDKKIDRSPAFIALEKKFKNLEISIFYNSHRYNKETRYFNTRKAIFPGFLIAKLFGLEKIHFLEITTNQFTPEKLRS
ncbi:MAG: LemA family protein [Desulfobacteraceae bacterium]|nr:LemA family protein [Desulfobacteraceae bacterium]